MPKQATLIGDYFKHLPACNINQQTHWDEAQAAVNDCPQDEGTSIATKEIAEKRIECTCGLQTLLDLIGPEGYQFIVLRNDVRDFAVMMSAAMDSKAVERDSRNQPHYMAEEYDLAQAILALCDKTDQLAYDAAVRPENVDQVRKTAVHLANFCMIIHRKASAGQHTTPVPGLKVFDHPSGFTSSTAAREQRSHDAELKRISTELDCAPAIEEIIRRIRKLKERQA